jgi:hypothetical protein
MSKPPPSVASHRSTIAVPSHVTWGIGQIVYARWRWENVTREWNPSMWELIREVERRVRQKQAPSQENARP